LPSLGSILLPAPEGLKAYQSAKLHVPGDQLADKDEVLT
jgi:hypothetical protein